MGDEGKPPASLAAREAGRREGCQSSPCLLDGQREPRPAGTCRKGGNQAEGVLRGGGGASDTTFGEHLLVPDIMHGLWVQTLSLLFSSHVTPDTLPSPVSIEANPWNQ